MSDLKKVWSIYKNNIIPSTNIAITFELMSIPRKEKLNYNLQLQLQFIVSFLELWESDLPFVAYKLYLVLNKSITSLNRPSFYS